MNRAVYLCAAALFAQAIVSAIPALERLPFSEEAKLQQALRDSQTPRMRDCFYAVEWLEKYNGGALPDRTRAGVMATCMGAQP